MNDRLAGIAAGLLAGAAGATAHDLVNYVHHAVTGRAAPSSPTAATPTRTADQAGDDAGPTGSQAQAAGPLSGALVGVGIGGAAGGLRALSTTPPQPVAALALGGAAWGAAIAGSAATGAAPAGDVTSAVVDGLSHLAYGVVTVLTLHWLLDPRTPLISR